MGASISDEQIQDFASTAVPLSVAVLSWGPRRDQDGAEAIELEHQRRMVSLHAEGVIVVLCPVMSDTISGVAIMDRSQDDAAAIMGEDPCVQTGMITVEIHPCVGFPGDTVPASTA